MLNILKKITDIDNSVHYINPTHVSKLTLTTRWNRNSCAIYLINGEHIYTKLTIEKVAEILGLHLDGNENAS